MLQLRGFSGTRDKVKLVEFHPVQPWIAFADKADNVRVWDWTTQQALHELQLGGADDEGSMEAAINTVPAKDPAFISNPSALSYAPSRTASGKVRQVAFLDPEVAYWQTATQHAMVNGNSTNRPDAVNVHALDGTRLLVVVCENKVLLHDLNTRKPYEVPRAALDGKSPTCVSFLFRGGKHAPGGQPDANSLMTSPVLAIGCSDGAVRLLHLATLRVIGKLVGNHKAAISCLLTLPSKAHFKTQEDTQQQAAGSHKDRAGRHKQQQQQDRAAALAPQPPPEFVPSVDLVFGGDSAGGLFVWEPFRLPLGSAEREVAPRVAVAGHAGEVWAACLAPGPEDSQAAAAKIFTAGSDHRLAAWDATSFAELWRTKLDAKSPATSLAYSHRYFNLSGAHALLATVNGPGVVAAYTLASMPAERGLRACANLAGLVPPGSKKVPKAYTVAVSPVRPNLAAVGCNTGMAFMTFDRMYPLPVAALPLRNLAEAHISPTHRLPREPVAASYVGHMGDAVCVVNCTAVEKDVGGVKQLVPQVVSQEPIGPATGRTGRAIVGVSATGEYVSVCWPASRAYVVYYRTLAATWQQVDSGLGVDLAWHSSRNMFAVLEEPPPPAPSSSKSKKWGARKEDPKAAAAEAAVLAAAIAGATVVRIKSLDGLGVSMVCQQVALSGDVPVGLHGGPLLGIAMKRMTSSGAELSGEEASPVLQFFSWNGVSKLGPELPEPSAVAWDPTLRYLALAYLRQVQIFRAQPQLESLGSLPVAGTTSVAWGVRQLYIATPTSVLLAFVAAEERSGASFSLLDMGPADDVAAGSTLQFVQLAGLTGTTATSSLREDSSGADASLPGPCPRPAGPVLLLGPRQGNLWLVNCLGQPQMVPLDHPGIRSRCLCAQGDLVGAVAVARHGLAPGQHDSIASFLRLQGGLPGAHLGLMGLQGLSLEMEAELCMATGQWRRACVCCEALMRGCNDRATLASSEAYAQALPDAAAEAADTGPSSSGGEFNAVAALSAMKDAAAAAAVTAAPPPQATVAKQQQQMWGLMGFGGLFVDEYQLPAEPEQEAVDKAKDPLAKGEVAWGAPLQHDWQFAEPPKRLSSWDGSGQPGWDPEAARSSAGLVAAATAVAAAAQPPPASAVSLAMRLVEGSQAAGITDVTRRASQLLLAHRGLLTAPQLARLAAKMAEVGMTREITGLVDSSVASGSHQGQAVGFVAAALTGDLVRLQRALQLSGTDALAALQSNTYRLPTAMATERCWNAALQHISAAAATHATSSYAYYTVTQSGL